MFDIHRERSSSRQVVCGGRIGRFMLAVSILCLLGGTERPVSGLDCFSNNLFYTQTGDGTTELSECSTWGYCAVPILGAPVYSMDDPSCNPYLGSCVVHADFTAEFPGNHQNDPSKIGLYYSYGKVELHNNGGSLVGVCGVAGQVILQDYGDVTVTASASCANPAAGKYNVIALMCPGSSVCEETTNLELDLAAAAGCIDLRTQDCGSGDASCKECLAGGVGAGGSPPGFGGPGSPATGPGARLRYVARGVGHPNLPGSAAWNTILGRYWSHDYAQRIVPAPDESHVYLLTQYGTFREWSSPDGTTGVYSTVSPSNEYRTLTWTGTGWNLTELDGTVHAFDGSGLWLSTTDRNGNAKVAVYSGAVLSQVQFPDGRREDFGILPRGRSVGRQARVDHRGRRRQCDQPGVDVRLDRRRLDANRPSGRNRASLHLWRSILSGLPDARDDRGGRWRFDSRGACLGVGC